MIIRIISGLLFYLMIISPTHTKAYRTDDFEEYRKEYIRIAKLFNKSPRFINKAKNTVFYKFKENRKVYGECYYFLNTINIHELSWEYLSVENREELIFHEMAHCVQLKEHSETGIMKGEGGLMNPKDYRKNYSKYINELFDCPTLDCVDIKFNPNKYKKKRRHFNVDK